MDSTLVSLFLFSFWMSWYMVQFPAVYSKEVTIKDESMTDWFSLRFSSYQGGIGENWGSQISGAVRTCGIGERAEFWFLTHFVNLTTTSAEIIYVDIEAEVKKWCFHPVDGYVQCYSNFFEIYVYRGNVEIDIRAFTTGAEILSSLRVFSSLYNITNITLPNTNVTKNTQTFSFLQNKSLGVTFAILSRGACGTLFRMKMYYYRCNEIFYKGIRFQTTVSPAIGSKSVFGKCSKNSTALNNATSIERYCYANGTWSIPVNESLKCLCVEGHELNKDGRCLRCLDTSYKKNISNDECTECPENTISIPNRTSCDCKEDFYGVPNNNPESYPCYALPEFNKKPAVFPNANNVNISWIKPENSANILTVFYDVECYNCFQTNISCCASCSNVGYHPSQSNLATTWVVISNLEYSKSYFFRVYVRNNLNDQVGREKWNYTETDRVDITHEPTKTSKKPLTSEDDYSSLYIIIGALSVVVVLILIAFILICILRRYRHTLCRFLARKSEENKTASGYINRGVELPDVGRRLYVDPSNYEDPEVALAEFTNELDSKLVILERLIGGGEFGNVYRGVLTTKDKKKIPIAAKTLKHDADEKSKRDFILEASVMGQFDNPNIVRLEGVITKSTPRMIVLEYMSNGSLHNHLKRNDSMLTNLQLFGMARGVAAGMKYLAEMNFVHRDLAARNILVNDDFLCKIADFGLSRVLETSRAEYSSHGGKIPIRWTAPEAINFRKFSSASDVWSFGIVLWEIMSYAKRPYWQWDNRKVLEELDSGYRLPAPNNCPEPVHELMLYCWKADRSERPSFAQITIVIDQWIRSPDTLDDDTTSSTTIEVRAMSALPFQGGSSSGLSSQIQVLAADHETDMEYVSPDDIGTEKHDKGSLWVDENNPREEPETNVLVYVTPLDNETKSQEESIAEERRGTRKSDSIHPKLLEDNDGYLLPADGETNVSRNAKISEPSAHAKQNENARDGRDMENTGNYQELLKRDSDVENVNDYQKLLKCESDYLEPADGDSASNRKVQTLESSAYTTEHNKNGKTEQI